MNGRSINLHDIASALAEMEPATKALNNLGTLDKAKVSMAISYRRIADALEKMADGKGEGA